MILYINLLLLQFLFLFKSIPFTTVTAFFPSGFRSFIVVFNVRLFIIFTPKYLYFAKYLIYYPYLSVKFRCTSPTHMFSVLLMLISSPLILYFSISLRVIMCAINTWSSTNHNVYTILLSVGIPTFLHFIFEPLRTCSKYIWNYVGEIQLPWYYWILLVSCQF